MLNAEFRGANGARYSIQMRSATLQEREDLAKNIRVDTTLWTSAERRKAGFKNFSYIPEDPSERQKPKLSQDRSHRGPRKKEDKNHVLG